MQGRTTPLNAEPLGGEAMALFEKKCPDCQHRMSWSQRMRFASWWGRRRDASCPSCGALLRWPVHWYALSALSVQPILLLLLDWLSEISSLALAILMWAVVAPIWLLAVSVQLERSPNQAAEEADSPPDKPLQRTWQR